MPKAMLVHRIGHFNTTSGNGVLAPQPNVYRSNTK